MEGAHELKIFGKYVPVKAHYRNLEALSAHADQTDILWWLSELKSAPEQLFLVHGESTAQDALRIKISEEFGWQAQIPHLLESISIP
jgi:metallo-beta-lactamase family protein